MTGNFRDGVNFFSKLTFRRAWNFLLLVISYHISRWLQKPIVWGKPFSISIEPTTSCNLRCPECPSGLRSFTRATGMLEASHFHQVVDQVSAHTWYLLMYFQGEPYLHKQFLDLVRYAHQKGLYVATSTNAHYLDDEMAQKTVRSGLDRIIISIDGTTQETYESYRVGGKLEKVLEGTRNLVKWKRDLKSSTPHILFQFLVVKPNQHQIDEVYRLAEELGVDEVGLKTAQIYDYKNGSALMTDLDQYSRYTKNKDGTYSIKSKLLNQCWKMWHSAVITWDGKVVPCCFDKDAHHSMGSTKELSFSTIWKSTGYMNFRQQLLSSRTNIEMCRNCTEGTKIWA
ncbi:MAG: SPASM domain-containing protein [Cytophagaceae bacterium]|jgi:radical SAM protein with 4Fe4S-binding SPASM domain|nr:SPASM domain-containing protein [Cytophagaceae bacterium]